MRSYQQAGTGTSHPFAHHKKQICRAQRHKAATRLLRCSVSWQLGPERELAQQLNLAPSGARNSFSEKVEGLAEETYANSISGIESRKSAGTGCQVGMLDPEEQYNSTCGSPKYRSASKSGRCWVGSCRRDLLDDDRTHLTLAKGTPTGRKQEKQPGTGRRIVLMPRLGGLHHGYDLTA